MESSKTKNVGDYNSKADWGAELINIFLSPLLRNIFFCLLFSPEVESRTEGSRPRSRTQKIQGQGQPFRGQTLSRPRTGMLKAKDQGHSRKCSPKKKSRQTSFLGNLQFIGVARILIGGGGKPQISCNDVIENFQKRNFFWAKDIVGWKI